MSGVPLLAIDDLAVTYRTAAGLAHAVDGADLVVPRGTMLGLVGESGCGKTTLARALMGVLPGNARVARGEGGRTNACWRRSRTGPCCGAATYCCSKPVTAAKATRSSGRRRWCCGTC